MAAPEGNRYAVGNNGGRPPHYSHPDTLAVMIDAYFDEVETDGKHPTISGLTLYVGFASLSSWDDYAKKEEFSYIVKRAKLKVAGGYESNLAGSNPTGSIFALKNMGWSDKTEIDHTTKGNAIGTPDLSKYTDDDLRILAELQRKSGTSEA